MGFLNQNCSFFIFIYFFFCEGNGGWQCPEPPGAAHVGRSRLILQDKLSLTPLITSKSEIQGFP